MPHIAGLKAYVPGRQPIEDGWMKLNTNENPYPPSPEVARAVATELERIKLYPEPSSYPLREAVASHHDLDPGNVIIGNGSDDILNLLVRVFSSKNRPAATCVPSYSLYLVLVSLQGARLLRIPYPRDMT